MKVIISHPTGNQNVRNTIKSLQERNHLFCFVTSLSFSIKKKFLIFFPKFIKEHLNRRSYKNYTKKIINTSVLFEIMRLSILKFFKINGIDKLYKDIDFFTAKYIAKNKESLDAIYAYEDGALESFKEAKKHNIKCIYEQPTAYWRVHDKNTESEKKMRKESELKLADIIIVASSWAAKSFDRSSQYKSKIHIVPYGFPEKVNINRNNWYNGIRPLKVLFAGQFTDRKGIPFLIKALAKIPKNLLELTFLGRGPYEKELKQRFSNARFISSAPYEQVLKVMGKNDVLIMPSLADGFGLVISESMSQGMAVIATGNTALKDIYNGRNSILIPAKNVNKIYESILFLIKNPKKVKAIGLSALQYSKKNSWVKYRRKLYKLLHSHICKH